MRQGEVVARDDQGGFPFPWFGVAFSVLVSILMLGVTAALWSDLPRMVPSGSSGMDGEPSLTPRWLFATAAPGVALTTALCVAIGPAIGSRAHPAPGRFSLSGRSVRALMDFLLVLINVFLLALHTVVLTSEVRKPLVASVELLAPLLVGGLMAGLGLLIALLRTRRVEEGPSRRWWDRARGPVGMSVVALGLLVAFVGVLFSQTVVWSHLLGLLPLAVAVGCTTPFVGNQDWKNHPGSHP